MEKLTGSTKRCCICCTICSAAFCRPENFPPNVAFLPGTRQEFCVFSIRYVWPKACDKRARGEDRAGPALNPLKGSSARLPPDCFRHLPQNHTQWTYPSAEVCVSPVPTRRRNASNAEQWSRNQSQNSLWGRFCSVGLQADIVDASTCPPEGGRHKDQARALRGELRFWARRDEFGLGLQRPQRTRITHRHRRGGGCDRWIRASGRGGPDTDRRRRFLHPIRAFRRKEMAREALQGLRLKTA